MSRKNFFVTILIALLTFMALLFLFIQGTKAPQKKGPELLSPTPVPLRINVSGVRVNNFLKNPKEVNASGDVLFEETKGYQFVYFPSSNLFMITVLSSPFETVRKDAEEDFVKILGVSRKEACKLNVVVNTPYFANPDVPAKDYPLSFCEENK